MEQELDLYEQMGWDTDELYQREAEKFLDYGQLTIESQQALYIYNILPDKVDGAAVGWYGKDYSELSFFLELYDIYDYRKVVDLILVCNSEYAKFCDRERQKADRKNK